MEVTYIAKDGRVFDNETMCKRYELFLKTSKKRFNFPHIHFFDHNKQELHFAKLKDFENAYTFEEINFVYLDHAPIKEVRKFITYLEDGNHGRSYGYFLVTFRDSMRCFDKNDYITDLGSVNLKSGFSLHSQIMTHIQEMLREKSEEKTK